MASELKLEIVTPFGTQFDDVVKSCTLPGALGQFQVLRDHAAMVSVINVGPIKIERSDNNIVMLATSGGYCEIKDNIIKVIVESAEDSSKINMNRAESARERAEKRLHSEDKEVDIDRARFALARAVNRIKVAQLR